MQFYTYIHLNDGSILFVSKLYMAIFYLLNMDCWMNMLIFFK